MDRRTYWSLAVAVGMLFTVVYFAPSGFADVAKETTGTFSGWTSSSGWASRASSRAGEKSISATFDFKKEPVKTLIGVLNFLKTVLKLPDSTFKTSGSISYTFSYLDEKPRVPLSHRFDGTASLQVKEVKFLVPGWSIKIPYCKVGIFVSPDVGLDVGLWFTGTNSSRRNPPKYAWSGNGGPTLRAAIGIGALISAGDAKWLKAQGEVKGSVGASATGTLSPSTQKVNISGSIGELKATGSVKVWVVGREVTLPGEYSYTAWGGMPFSGQIQLPLQT